MTMRERNRNFFNLDISHFKVNQMVKWHLHDLNEGIEFQEYTTMNLNYERLR